jgi:ankyrin repeat protein
MGNKLSTVISQHKRPAVALDIVRSHPELVWTKDTFGRLPLHHAADSRASLEVIRTLAEKYPRAIQETDNEGNLPLHLAARSNATLKVVLVLTKKNPGALQKKNQNGCLPVHLAASHHSNFFVVQFLAEKNPGAVQERDNCGNLPLHLAAGRCFADEEVVHLLAKMYPEALQAKNHEGNLPLHTAALSAPLEVVKLLVELAPNALDVENNDGMRPVELARERVNTSVWVWLERRLETAEQNDNLAKASSGSSPAQNDSGSSLNVSVPTEISGDVYRMLLNAIQQNLALSTIRKLVQSNPSLVRRRDSEGWLPLHHAVKCANLAVVQHLVRQLRQTLAGQTNQGWLPLHIAIFYNAQFLVIHLLVETHPMALKEKDMDGNLPLHLAGAKANLKVVEFLVRNGSSALLYVKNSKGERPIDLARRHNNPDVAKWLEMRMRDFLVPTRSAPSDGSHDACFNAVFENIVESERKQQQYGWKSREEQAAIEDEAFSNESVASQSVAVLGTDSACETSDVPYLINAQDDDGPRSYGCSHVADSPRDFGDMHFTLTARHHFDGRYSVPVRTVEDTQDFTRVRELMPTPTVRREPQRVFTRSRSPVYTKEPDIIDYSSQCHEWKGTPDPLGGIEAAVTDGERKRGWAGEVEAGCVQEKDLKCRSSKQAQFWSNVGVHEVKELLTSLQQQQVRTVASLDVDVTPEWTYQFYGKDRVWAETLALCSTWLFPNGAPSRMMEPLLIDILRKLIDSRHAPLFRLVQIVFHRSSFVVTTCVALTETSAWLPVELLVALVTKESPICVRTCEMTEPTAQRLIVCAKGFVADSGQLIRRGGYDVVLASVRAFFAKGFHTPETDGITESLVCPECLQAKPPAQAAALDCELDKPITASFVWCRHGHRVDAGLIRGPAPDHVEAYDCQVAVSFRRDVVAVNLLRSSVIVVVAFADGSFRAGSGFVADRSLGLVLSAGHTVAKPSFDSPMTDVLIGERRKGDGGGVEFRYTAEIAAMGATNVDACVLRITGCVAVAVAVADPDAATTADDEASCDRPFLSDLTELPLACESFIDENLRLIGYNQGGEGAVPPGTILDYQPDVLRGYVCKFFSIKLADGCTRTEIVVEGGGRAIQGHSGGPCLNASGEVVGILSRSDSFEGRRWYLVPFSELQALLLTARMKSPTTDSESGSTAPDRSPPSRLELGLRWKR